MAIKPAGNPVQNLEPGMPALMRRTDTPGTVPQPDGTWTHQQCDSQGRLRVVVSGAGSGGTSTTDDSPFAVGVDGLTPCGYLADETTPDAVDEGDVGVPRMTLSRKPYAVISDPAAERHATVRDTGTNDSLNVAIVDAAGNHITSFGGSGGTASNFGSAVPAQGTAAGFSDGTNMQPARVFDTDTGGGTQYVLGASLRKSGSGGSVELGTLADPVRTDPVGTTTQPVSGTVSIGAALPAGGNNIGDVDVLTLPSLPAGTNNIGDVDVLSLPANASVNQTQVAGTTVSVNTGNSDAGTQRVVMASDQPPIRTTHGKTLASASGSVSASGDTQLAAAVIGQRHKVYGIVLTTASTTAVTVSLKDGATEKMRWHLQAISGATTGANLVVPPSEALFEGTANTALNINLSAAVTVHYTILYYTEA